MDEVPDNNRNMGETGGGLPDLPAPPREFLNPYDPDVPPEENVDVPPFLLGPPLFEGPPIFEEDTGSRVLFPPKLPTSTVATTSMEQMTVNITDNATFTDSTSNIKEKYVSETVDFNNLTTDSMMQNISTEVWTATSQITESDIRSLPTTELIVLCTVVPAVLILIVIGAVLLWYFIGSKKRRSNRRVGVGNEAAQENDENNDEVSRPPSSISKTLHSTAPNTAASNEISPNNTGQRQAWAVDSQTVPD